MRRKETGYRLYECSLCGGLVPFGPHYYNGHAFGKYFLCQGCRYNNDIPIDATEDEVDAVLKRNNKIPKAQP